MPSGQVWSVQLGDCYSAYSAKRLEDFQGDGQIMGLASYKARVLEVAAGSLGHPVSPAGHPPRVGFFPPFLTTCPFPRFLFPVLNLCTCFQFVHHFISETHF